MVEQNVNIHCHDTIDQLQLRSVPDKALIDDNVIGYSI